MKSGPEPEAGEIGLPLVSVITEVMVCGLPAVMVTVPLLAGCPVLGGMESAMLLGGQV